MFNHLHGGCREDRARLLSAVPSDRIGGSGHKLTHRRPCLNRGGLAAGSVLGLLCCLGFFIYCEEGVQALEQIHQRGCGVSIPGYTHGLMGHSPCQPAAAVSALSRELKLMRNSRSQHQEGAEQTAGVG